MRLNFPILLVLCAILFAACSFPIDFVVINESDLPIEIRLKGMRYLDSPDSPAKVSASQLDSRDWQELSASEYQFDRENRIITVRVLPGEALRVAQVLDSNMWNGVPISFPLEEINITGRAGEIRLRGRQVPNAFIAQTKRIYRFTYRNYMGGS